MKFTINITPVRQEDIDTLWKWGEENWELWGDEKNKWFSKKSLKRWINDPKDDILLVARHEDRVIGMCMVSVLRDWAFCFGLFVEKDYRSQGIGKKLLEEVEKRLKKEGVTNLTLLADVKNRRGLKFYEREKFYKGFEFIMMTKDLRSNL